MKHFILISTILFALLISAGPLDSERSDNCSILLEMSLEEYRKVLPVIGPQDRLYIE